MKSQGIEERRHERDETKGLAKLALDLGVPVDQLPLQRVTDRGREETLLMAANAKLLAAAGLSAEKLKPETGLAPVEPTGHEDAKAQERAPEAVWIGQFKTRFYAFPQLHKGIRLEEVERALKADPEGLRSLQAFDAKGHQMNVFGEENGEFIVASAWDNVEQVAADHRDIVFDPEAQQVLTDHYPYEECNGNAVSIIAKIMGVEEDKARDYLADQKLSEELRKAVDLMGWAWLKTDAETRKAGNAFNGDNDGFSRFVEHYHSASGSFRVALRFKKV
ncbi:MAG: hypothetical protein UW70_C0049G0006 [Candidatus Peregrinibacteria bacterium GW2011_GWA2_44_7]|nr:MAG: hypothetical protein UW70_C0049G0006 [Candidatus Peregrinibacteria bacterium GW2011_GWA2_44_7]